MVEGSTGKRFEIKTKVVGEGEGECQEARVLNRIIRRESWGWSYEPDQRHAELIVKHMGLKEDSRPLATPGKKDKEGSDNPLNAEQTRMYR